MSTPALFAASSIEVPAETDMALPLMRIEVPVTNLTVHKESRIDCEEYITARQSICKEKLIPGAQPGELLVAAKEKGQAITK
jgi:hypothetical protein